MIKKINILKPLGGWVIKLKNNRFFKARMKLMLYYMLSVFFILVIFSFSIFFLFSNNFVSDNNNIHNTVKVLEGHDGGVLSKDYIKEEAKELLLKAILTVDLLILLLAFIISFFSLKKVLLPIEEFSKKQEKFTAHAAHELRTPLAVMKAGYKVFSSGRWTESEYKSFISSQEKEVTSLIEMSNNLLLLLKTKRNRKENFKVCDLGDIARKRLESFKKYSAEKNIIFKTDIKKDVKVFCNYIEIEIIFNNLLKNAIDYNFKNGVLEVMIFKKNNRAFITIENTSVGIKKGELKYVFDNFFKSSNNFKSGIVSSGIGLSIVKEIVLKHKGNINVFSEENKKTRFFIQLPLNY